jgi:hypothetical protein
MGAAVGRKAIDFALKAISRYFLSVEFLSRFRVLLKNLVQLSLPHFPIPHTYIDLTLQYLIQPQFNPSISRTCALFTHRNKSRLAGLLTTMFVRNGRVDWHR